ncbi:MAG: tetratricopeptide repeat protein [Cytophagales bacterium]
MMISPIKLSVFFLLIIFSHSLLSQHRLVGTQLEITQNRAKQGDKGAQLLLGLHYLSIANTGDYKAKGRYWLQKSADQGLKEGQYEYAKEIYRDKKRETDKIALTYFEKSAKQGHYPAALEAAQMYYFGFGTLRYPNKALDLFRICAEKGNAKAQYFLAKIYYEGEGTEKNKNIAFKWCSKSSDQGYAPAQLLLAKMYLNADGTIFDGKKAAILTKSAFEKGEEEAQILWDNKELWRYVN